MGSPEPETLAEHAQRSNEERPQASRLEWVKFWFSTHKLLASLIALAVPYIGANIVDDIKTRLAPRVMESQNIPESVPKYSQNIPERAVETIVDQLIELPPLADRPYVDATVKAAIRASFAHHLGDLHGAK